jgi:hypothetical protein
VRSACSDAAAAALESGVGVAALTRGLPARGFHPLFARYPGQAVAQVAVSLAPFEPEGAARWPARLAGIRALAAAGVPVWLRLDPAVPSRSDQPEVLSRWMSGAAAAGARGVVVAPLVFDAGAQELVGDDPAVVDYYRPGRRRKRGVLPAPPVPHLPLERETALAWRVRTVAEDHGLAVRVCRCDRGVPGSCGLLPPATAGVLRAVDDRQIPLFAG